MKKKALHIVTRLDKGGLADTVLKLCSGLQDVGYKVTCVAGLTSDPHPEFLSHRQQGKIPLIIVDELRRSIHPYFDLLALLKLIRIIGAEKPDIVHTHSSKAGILGRLAAAVWRIPVCIHSPHGHIFYGYFDRWVTQFFILLERLLTKFTTKITTLTHPGKNDHVRLKVGPPEKFAVIPCGIQYPVKKPGNDTLKALKQHIGLNGEKVIGWVGRLEPIKGCDIFLEACRIIHEKIDVSVKYIIVGDGSESAVLKNKARQFGIDNNTVFLGSRTDVPDLMHLFDLFVLSSRNEGLGRVILEAMTCSVPVIATKVGGVPEIISNNVNGKLVPTENSVALALAMENLLLNDELSNSFVEKAQNTFRHFHFQNMIHRTDLLYQELSQ